MITWTELADALRDATGPSRELDAALFQAIGGEGCHQIALALCEAFCRAMAEKEER